jgi:hypothetical protein
MDNFFKLHLCFTQTLNSLNWVLDSILGCTSLLAANPDPKPNCKFWAQSTFANIED